ncbi:hypothetical protein [Streptomyces sp. NPDC088178]|uniref:hypothetical protein n=1 Tax=Streptomyces sp. NPDC088178 TaxID=3365836 RepID=UPI003813D4D6
MNHDTNRIVWLFDKPYWWERQASGRLALQPAPWEEEADEKAVVNVAFWGDASEFARKVAEGVDRVLRKVS